LIAKEASEQCHRQIIPEIVGVYDINKLPPELLSDVNLVAYEKCEDSPLLEIKGKSISILIGSEGGFDKKEIENLKKAGFKSVSLGKRILRTETAAVYALSVLGYYLEK
jgi:16S rRNA (uracil1498-N3)-methyltransferase